MNHNNRLEILHELIFDCKKYASGSSENSDAFLSQTYFFLNKILTHSITFEFLYKSNLSDSLLIARSIIEGFALLHYSSQNMDSLPIKWRLFSYIEAYKYIKLIIEKGEKLDLRLLKEMENDVTKYCSVLEVKKNGQIIGNKRYKNSWYDPMKITQVIELVPFPFLRIAYYDYSIWHHWGPLGIASTVKKDKNEYSIQPHISIDDSIMVIIFCLINTVNILLTYQK